MPILCREVAQQLQEDQAALESIDDDTLAALPRLARKYVQLRRQLLHSYTLNATFFLYLHAKGVKLHTHPCTTTLVKLQKVCVPHACACNGCRVCWPCLVARCASSPRTLAARCLDVTPQLLMTTAEEHGSIRHILMGQAPATSKATLKPGPGRAKAAARAAANDFGDADEEDVVQAAPRPKKSKAGKKAAKAPAKDEGDVSDDILDGDSDDLDDSYYQQIAGEKERKKQAELQAYVTGGAAGSTVLTFFCSFFFLFERRRLTLACAVSVPLASPLPE